MSKTLAEKILYSGETLRLEKYHLNSAEAEALRRSVGSYEMVLALATDISGENTDPSASWYLDQNDFKKLYDTIKNRQDFKRVKQFLDDNIQSPSDSDEVNSFLETITLRREK
tara:strand:- start:8490 stop:8828 length:339 start_codon:yes stop_codon:yes gene_type:complete